MLHLSGVFSGSLSLGVQKKLVLMFLPIDLISEEPSFTLTEKLRPWILPEHCLTLLPLGMAFDGFSPVWSGSVVTVTIKYGKTSPCQFPGLRDWHFLFSASWKTLSASPNQPSEEFALP